MLQKMVLAIGLQIDVNAGARFLVWWLKPILTVV